MDQGAIGKITLLESPQNEEAPLPPWLFRHNDLMSAMASAGTIDKKKLTNILNYLHFKGNHLYALLNLPGMKRGFWSRSIRNPCWAMNCSVAGIRPIPLTNWNITISNIWLSPMTSPSSSFPPGCSSWTVTD